MRRDWADRHLGDHDGQPLIDLVLWVDPRSRSFRGDRANQSTLYTPLNATTEQGEQLWISARYDERTNGLSVSIAPASQRVQACEEDLQRHGVASRVGLVQRDLKPDNAGRSR